MFGSNDSGRALASGAKWLSGMPVAAAGPHHMAAKFSRRTMAAVVTGGKPAASEIETLHAVKFAPLRPAGADQAAIAAAQASVPIAATDH